MQGLKQEQQHHGNSARPISPAEAATLFDFLKSHPRLALAVSGGGDSLALMHLIARWAATTPDAPALHVLTVNHGLQPDSEKVAQQVCAQAASLDLPCTILRWQGKKPATGIEQAAREARYALLGAWCRQHDAALVTAHTLNDQAETFLMRLMRGAGVDGLSAMPRQGTVPGWQPGTGKAPAPPVPLLRPLLDVPRARLRATLQALGITWHEDPANADERFERTRLRRLLPLLQEGGLTPAAIATSARRLHRARAALEAQTAAFLHQHVQLHALGWAELPRQAFHALPEEIRLRVLARLLGALGGTGAPLRDMAGLERLLHWLAEEEPGRARVLAGAHIARRKHALIIGREPGRPGPSLTLAPDTPVAVWDNRFHITLENLREPVQVRMLAELTRTAATPSPPLPSRPKKTPAFAWRSQPAIIHGWNSRGEDIASQHILALPAIGWHAPDAPFKAASAKLRTYP